MTLVPTPPEPATHLSTSSVPERDRFDYWLDVICALYVGLDCEPPPDRGIFGEVELHRIGPLSLTHVRSNGTRIRRTPARIRQDSEDYCLVLIQRAGRGALRQDGRTGVMQPGDFVLNDCTRPYELIFDDAQHQVDVLRLPRQALAPHVRNLEALCASTVSGAGSAGHLLLHMVDALRQQAGGPQPAAAPGIADAITSVIGAGLRSLPQAQQRAPSQLAAYHLARIKAHVQQQLRDPALSLQSVAQAVQLSADHVGRLFRQEPMPLSRLIWTQRLEACSRELADPRLAARSVGEIAYGWGFNDASHFSRIFRARHGLSPRDWRAQQLQQQRRP